MTPSHRAETDAYDALPTGPSLNETLSAAGYTTRPATRGKVILRDGVEVFSGAAHEVWAWLKTQRPQLELALVQR